jgi:NAD(P)-dependent dehydrogenase (short-subunit alcohol dehydrogenase family)
MVALVTGGAQGIGRTIAEELIMIDCKVVIADIDEIKAGVFLTDAVSNGHDHTQLQSVIIDLKQEGAAEQMFEEALACFGRIDIVCQCAGIFTKEPSMARKLFETKLLAIVDGTYKAIDVMQKQSNARINCIVNIGSQAGLKMDKLAAFHTTCEAGVVNFTRAVSQWDYKNLDGHKIKISCVCPGSVETKNAKFNWDRRPSSDAFVKKHGTVNIVEVVKAFLLCLESDRHGKIIAVTPTGGIKEVEFNDQE